MTPIKLKDAIVLCGKVTRDAQIRYTRNGKPFVSFGMMYDRHYNEDGQKVNEYMDVTVWDETMAEYIGGEATGVEKGDYVLVAGQLVEDTFRKDGEDPNVQKWKVNATIVFDMTSFYQLAGMVVGGGESEEEEDAEAPTPTPKPAEKKPKQATFIDVEGDEDGELPF